MNYYPVGSSSARPSDKVNVAEILQSASSSLRVSRFTAAGGDATTGATFAGQSWENGGVASGTKVYEAADEEGMVEVADSEGLLVEVSA